jgi:hypothetical protein
MAENIDIGTFTFDSASVEKSLKETKDAVYELTEQQKDLRRDKRELEKAIQAEIKVQKTLIKTSDEQSEEYQKAEKNIKSLNKKKRELYDNEQKTNEELKTSKKEQKDLQKIMGSLTDKNGKRISSIEAVNNALERENRTINETRQSNKELLQLRNELDLTTDEGIETMERLNDKLNENNQAVKENVSGYEQQKINIGNYEGAVEGALGPLGEFVQMSQEAGGVLPLVSAGLSSAKTALIGFTKAAITFIATPIGIVIAALAAGFLLVQNALNRSEDASNKLSKAMAPLSALFNKILSALEPLGGFLIDGIVEGFELAEKAVSTFLNTATIGLAALGFDEAAKGVQNFKNEIEETAAAGLELAEAEAELTKAQRLQRLAQLEYQKEAEEYRQIRDDENKTIQERISANEELGNVLNRQVKEERRLAEQALLVANLRIAQEGSTKETLDAQAEALTEIADIEERITGQRSEQLVNRNSLEKEGLELIKERQAQAIEASEQELELFLAQQGFREKSAEEQLAIARQTRDKEIAIQEEKFETKQINQTQYEAAIINIKNEFLEEQRDLAIENAEAERDALLESIEKRKTDYKEFTQERLDFEIQNSQDILEEDKRLADLQFEEGAINEQEYQDKIQEIRNESRERETEAKLLFDEANKERELIDLENERILADERLESDFERRAAELERQKQQEIASAEDSGAKISLINKKYANEQEKIEREKERAKRQMYADTLGSLASILGEQTKAGKAVALAQALINTYQGISAGVALGFPAAIPAVAAATATGFAAVKNITQTKVPQAAKGRLIKGNTHSKGGEIIEAEDGEPILTRKSFKMFPQLISDINVAGGGIPLAARGRVAGNSVNNSIVQNRIMQSIDMNVFAESIGESVREGALQGSSTGTLQGSQQGITNLSERRQIQKENAF